MSIKHRWLQLRAWWRRTWFTIRPGPEARKGAVWAVLAAAAWAAVVGGVNLHSGFGLAVDLLSAFAVAGLGIPLLALVVALLLTIFRKLPRWSSGIIFGACIFIGMLWQPPLGFGVGTVFGIIEGILGATVATFLLGHFREAALSKRIITVVLCLIAIGANIAVYIFLSSDGITEELIRLKQAQAPAPAMLAAPNPAEPGSETVKTLFYGSGTDLRRTEYGRAVAIKTPTLDASKFFKEFKGWKANLRRRYWGFGMDKLPLNARVWYPEGAGPFPLVLIVHGNHGMAQFSDPGYEYLGKLLASRGFMLASIDENFLNGGLFHEPPKQQAARGWMLLEHLKLWRAWNATPGNPFYHKVDVDNVALMGHSRGGEAVATAALFNKLKYYPDDATIPFNYNFPIKSLVAIAPVDGQYKPAGQWRHIENVNYLTLQGANDADVSSFDGSRQWDHVRFAKDDPGFDPALFKAELYIYRANHGQFNTVWGRADAGAPTSWLLNLRPLLSGEDQRRIGKTYIAAFLEATLHNRREYVPLFRDHRTIRDWLPDTLYINRYLDASDQVVTDFSEDPDVTTTTVPGGHIRGENLSIWREGKIPSRHGDRDYNGVFLGWNRQHDPKAVAPPIPVYSLSLPDDAGRKWRLGAQSILTLSLAVTDDKADPPGKKPDEKVKKSDKKKDGKEPPEPTDFTVELEAGGATVRLPLSRFGVLPPPFKVRFTKLASIDDFFYQKASEPIFQTIELPLGVFAAQNESFDPAKLQTIRLRFDRTETRVVILSEIALGH